MIASIGGGLLLIVFGLGIYIIGLLAVYMTLDVITEIRRR